MVGRAGPVAAARPGCGQGMGAHGAGARAGDGRHQAGARLGGRAADVGAARPARRARRPKRQGPLWVRRRGAMAPLLGQQFAGGGAGARGGLWAARGAVGHRAAQRAWRPRHGSHRGRHAPRAAPLLPPGLRHHPRRASRCGGRFLRAVLVRLLGVGSRAARASILQCGAGRAHVHRLRRLHRRHRRRQGRAGGARFRLPAAAAPGAPPHAGGRVGAGS
mmetsp:Transcript_23229/g.75237  ORF Transcript_23229/g.75237 Transcript_23229/m.75237 type:complete len:219 (-) Transcript_23229:1308-1964(-)